MRVKPTVRVFAGRLDVIPLVNVIFLLLIFFVISSSMVFQAGITVDLPRATDPEMRAADKLVITITSADQLYFNDKPVKWDELERELRELVIDRKVVMARRGAGEGTPRQPGYSALIVLRADKNAPYSRVLEVMSLARFLKVGVFLVTEFQPSLQGRAPGAKRDAAD